MQAVLTRAYLAALLLTSASLAGAGHTQVIMYHPTHMAVTQTSSGSCWTGGDHPLALTS